MLSLEEGHAAWHKLQLKFLSLSTEYCKTVKGDVYFERNDELSMEDTSVLARVDGPGASSET